MSGILAFLSAKGSALAMGAAIPVILMIAAKMIPTRIGNLVAGLLNAQMGKLDALDDPIKRGLYTTLALDIIRIVENEIPDAGKGEEKYKLAAKKLCAVIPLLKGQEDRIEALIESSVNAMDAELKKQIPGPP